jgi:ABC-type phosphate transport system substrate-binding protein
MNLRFPGGRAVIAAVACASILGPSPASAESGAYRIVVNAANPTATLTVKEVSDVFLGKAARWPDGTAVKPVDQSTVSPVRETFTREVHGKKVDAIVNYWQQVIFSGRGVPPPAKANDQEVLAYVKANPGGIGYVSQDAPLSGVKTMVVKP